MRANVGSTDRIVRIIIGLVLVVTAFVAGLSPPVNPALQWGAMAVGSLLIVTALVRFCPLYTLLGVSTCKVSTDD